MTKQLCDIHGTPMICPRCIAAKGGKRRTKKKLTAIKANMEKARKKRWPRK